MYINIYELIYYVLRHEHNSMTQSSREKSKISTIQSSRDPLVIFASAYEHEKKKEKRARSTDCKICSLNNNNNNNKHNSKNAQFEYFSVSLGLAGTRPRSYGTASCFGARCSDEVFDGETRYDGDAA